MVDKSGKKTWRRKDETHRKVSVRQIPLIIFQLRMSNHLAHETCFFYSGNKCIVLLHILAHASKLGEKTVVFSQSLKVCVTSIIGENRQI